MKIKDIIEGTVTPITKKQDQKDAAHREKVAALKDFLPKQKREFAAQKRRANMHVVEKEQDQDPDISDVS